MQRDKCDPTLLHVTPCLFVRVELERWLKATKATQSDLEVRGRVPGGVCVSSPHGTLQTARPPKRELELVSLESEAWKNAVANKIPRHTHTQTHTPPPTNVNHAT